MKAWQNSLWTVGVCVLYVATARLGLEYAVIGHTVTLLWPPSGVALAATLIGGYRVWVGIALGAVLANSGTGIPVLTLGAIALGNTLEPLCGASLLRRRKDFSMELDKVSDVFSFILFAAILSTTVSASLGTLGLLVGGEIGIGDVGAAWLTWWLGDGMGVLVISPVLLMTRFRMARAFTTSLSLTKTLEALAMIFTSTLIGQAIFENPKLAGVGHYPVALSMFPFAIWGALRFGSLGAATVTLIVSWLAIQGIVQGAGPFVVKSGVESQVRWCLFSDIMAITGLLLAAISSEREKALATLRDSHKDLEWQVQNRTIELTRTNENLQVALAERRRLQLEMNQITEERQKMIGQELHDGLGQQLTGIAFMIDSAHETLVARSAQEAPAVHRVGCLLGEAMAMLRSLSRGLYPIALETGGLSFALHQLAQHTRNFSKIQCAVHYSEDVQVTDVTTSLNLYRIAQEAVSNALRHGEAQRIDIELSGSGKHYVLSVTDDGAGFRDRSPQANQTLGLCSMRCRAEMIGAVIEIRKNPADGTSVVVTGPINREEHDIARRT